MQQATQHGYPSDSLVGRLDAFNAAAAAAQRAMFGVIVQADEAEVWRDAGARDMAHWLAMRYGISEWKARRWLAAAHALGSLPRLSEAFASGRLGVDKVVELARFATSETEGGRSDRVGRACVVGLRATARRPRDRADRGPDP